MYEKYYKYNLLWLIQFCYRFYCILIIINTLNVMSWNVVIPSMDHFYYFLYTLTTSTVVVN